MNSALSPREIQARLRAGASVPEVAAEAGVEVDRIEGFALPVMAERAHMTRTALGASVRRRGDGSGHRRLGALVRERLQARSLDADTVEWDAWRQNDLKWRVVGLLDDQAASRAAEFVFDPKGMFSVAGNADARWMIGETVPGPQTDPDNENTIDFNDELALVRAVSDGPTSSATGRPGDDVPPQDYEGAAHTSELDELYDMLSGVSEDSVRIYLGLDDPEDGRGDSNPAGEPTDSIEGPERVEAPPEQAAHIPADDSDPPPEAVASEDEPETTLADALSEHPEFDETPASDAVAPETAENDSDATPATPSTGSAADSPEKVLAAPEQDALVPDVAPSAPKRKPAKKRASIPSWDEIMFGGPPRG